MGKKPNIQRAMEIAQGKNGNCLSKTMSSKKDILKWRCSEGHIWNSTFKNVVYGGSWCRVCSLNLCRNTIVDMRKYAISKNGKCISSKYINSKVKLKWECSKGHIWEATPGSVYSNKTWCPYCSGKHLSIEDLKKIAIDRGGRCVSSTYKGTKSKLTWECSKRHQWDATPSSVKSGNWCPRCAGKDVYTIEDMYRFAANADAKFLSKNYSGKSKKYLWECKRGHPSKLTCEKITKSTTWCAECRNIKKIENLKKVVESRGGSISEPKIFKRNAYVSCECKRGHKFEKLIKKILIGTWCKECARLQSLEKGMRAFVKAHQTAASKNGKCLTPIENYVDSKEKYLWECGEGHKWKSILRNILKGSWCPHCYSEEFNLSDLLEFARSKDGQCISSEGYKGRKYSYRWICADGHQFSASFQKARSEWCPECIFANQKLAV